MSTFLKPVAALLVSILIFAGYTYLADAELLDFIQTRFYNPSVVNSYVKENAIDAEIAHNYIAELQNKFLETLSVQAVRSSFLYNQSGDDIFERSRIFGLLLESTGGLQSVQFVDSNGIRIHYSTSARDIINQSRDSLSFRNYNEDPSSLPFDIVSVPDGNNAKYIMDERSERIIFSYPFYDSMDVYRGTALFKVGIRALAEKLVAGGRLKVSDAITVIGDPAGILLGSPEISKGDISDKVADIWKEGKLDRVTLDSGDSGVNYSLISFRTSHGIFFGRLINDFLFAISEPMKLILKLSIFLTFFLTLYFLLNLKPNPVTVVRARFKRLRDSLLNQLYVNKTGQERLKWILELEQRRDGIRTELKHNLKLNPRLEKNINNIIDNSWDELLGILKSGTDGVYFIQKAVKTAATKDTALDGSIDNIEEVEALEEIGETESIEDAEEITEVGEAEEIDEIEEVESIDEIDEIEDAEEADEIEEIEEVEEIEEISDAEAVEEIEDLGEIEEIGGAEEPNIIDIALREALEPGKKKPRGLLKIASKFISGEAKAVPAKKGLLEAASKKVSAPKGLLARASKVNDKGAPSRSGLMALVSEIEFDQKLQPPPEDVLEFPVSDHEAKDMLNNLDIVSPFSSMFSSLDDDE